MSLNDLGRVVVRFAVALRREDGVQLGFLWRQLELTYDDGDKDLGGHERRSLAGLYKDGKVREADLGAEDQETRRQVSSSCAATQDANNCSSSF